MATSLNLLGILCLSLLAIVNVYGDDVDTPIEVLDVETPNTFNINSPLAQPDSLKSQPYFDFLSTLYAHDSTKASLFKPYQHAKRSVDGLAETPLEVVKNADENKPIEKRRKRALVFRPIFVYKQQEIKKEEARKKRRRV